jgi:hypothetical protein
MDLCPTLSTGTRIPQPLDEIVESDVYLFYEATRFPASSARVSHFLLQEKTRSIGKSHLRRPLCSGISFLRDVSGVAKS